MSVLRGLVAAGAALGLLALSTPLLASAATPKMTLQQARQQLQTIQSRLQQDQSLLSKTKQSLSQEQTTLAQVHDSLDRTKSQLDAALNWEATLTRRVAQKQREVAATQEHIAKDQKVVDSALVAIEQEGPGGYLNVLFGAQSFADFASRLSLLTDIVRADVTVIAQVQQSKQALVQQEQGLKKERAQYAAAAELRRQATDALGRQLSDQRQAVAALDSSYAKEESSVTSDEGSSAEITQLIKSLTTPSSGTSSASSADGGGGAGANGVHFIWPVVGPITSPFGMRVDPITHQYALHSGVDIGVPEGTPIHAAAAGQVIVAQYITGYGYTIIIDDGNNVANLYAHQERFAVSAGEKVAQGQVIGYVGMTGWATGPHLHFEVRINGNPVNPIPYMPPMP